MEQNEAPTVGRAMQLLAGVCDGAQTYDDVGFNKADAEFGHSLASRPEERWSDKQWSAGRRLIQKYHRQLAAVGLDVTAIPQQRPITAQKPRYEPARLSGRCVICGQQYLSGTPIGFRKALDGRWERFHKDCNEAPTVERQPQLELDLRGLETPEQISITSVAAVDAADSRAVEILGPAGLIALRLPGYESREPQLQLAAAIEQAIAGTRHLVSEAGTGTGKSLAYLVPVVQSGQRAIVSTAVKSLQEQLWYKDIPFLQTVMPFEAAIMKGRSNYACLQRLAEREQLPEELQSFRSPEAAAQWSAFQSWLEQTESGDLETASEQFVAELRAEITADSDSCLSQHCPLYRQCFVEKSKKRAEQAQVIIVNHSLLLRDLELRAKTGDHVHVLPDAKVVILDEAHHLEEVATESFGVEITAARWTRLARRIEKLIARCDPEILSEWRQRLEAGTHEITQHLEELRSRLHVARLTVQRLGDERKSAEQLLRFLGDLYIALKSSAPSSLDETERKSWQKLASQLSSFISDLDQVVSPDQGGIVRYAEMENAGQKFERLVLHLKPIDVAEALRDALWSKFSTVVATSATLATTGGFVYWRERVGCDEAEELLVASPFNYRQNVLLYLPEYGQAFDPSRFYGRDETVEYYDRLASEINALLAASDGRAFCLFTSNRVMNAVHERLVPRLRWLTLKQGQAPRQELVRRFKADGHAVLFGVKSFWEGVDIQGEALSLVVIDKLPFTPPDDPVWEARCEAINRKKGDKWAWFFGLAVPVATLALKQGFGRLIRTKSDRGVVALLDGRLTTKPYGSRILNALPPASAIRSLDTVQTFFA